MALVNCVECGAKVSDKATKCIACGIQLRKPRRGPFGLIFKWIFILFNILMVYWLFKYAGQTTNPNLSDGAMIGAGIGISLILGFWAIGDIILGILVLFTRPK